MKRLIFLLSILLMTHLTLLGQSQPLEETRFISIGEIEQWVTIKGASSSQPVILFLHGGPGSPLTPYADAVFKDWEKDFILVQWDQRGTGKTFGTYAPEELDPAFLKAHPLTLEQMVSDGIELSEYLTEHLGKQKIILFGTSWGSVLGAKMAAQRPDLFLAYIGHSQLINPSENNQYTYDKLVQLVKDENDEESLQLLAAIGAPPYDRARDTGKFIRVIKNYERKASDPFPDLWGKLPSEYNNPQDIQHRAEGDDYSFLSYAGDRQFGVAPMMGSINLLEDTYKFEIPVYLIQGENDILTPKEITREYFQKMEAPEKKLILIPNAAHGFNPAVVEAIYKVLKKDVVSTIRE